MKNYDGLMNRKGKEKYIGCSALANEKKAAWVASCDRYLKKKKKKKRQREKRKEKYIGCSALASEKKAAWVASCDRYFLNRKIRLFFGLGYESVFYIHRHQDMLVFGYMLYRLS